MKEWIKPELTEMEIEDTLGGSEPGFDERGISPTSSSYAFYAVPSN